jgi:hypothetical protein
MSSEDAVASSPRATIPLTTPQNLHVQFGQCQSPGGSICNNKKAKNASSTTGANNQGKAVL